MDPSSEEEGTDGVYWNSPVRRWQWLWLGNSSDGGENECIWVVFEVDCGDHYQLDVEGV